MDEYSLNQQVNLYLPEFRPRRDWLTVPRLMGLLGLLVLVLGSMAGYDLWRRYSLTQELAVVQQALDTQTRVTEEIESSLASRATDQSLVEEVATREESLASLNGTLATLRTLALGNVNGFSEHLKNISRSSFDGIWFSEIRITNGGAGAYLAGTALESSMVPNFIDRLTSGWVNSEGWRFSRIVGQMGEIVEEVPEVELTAEEVAVAEEAARAARIAEIFEQARAPAAEGVAAVDVEQAEDAPEPVAYPDSYQFTLETQ